MLARPTSHSTRPEAASRRQERLAEGKLYCLPKIQLRSQLMSIPSPLRFLAVASPCRFTN